VCVCVRACVRALCVVWVSCVCVCVCVCVSCVVCRVVCLRSLFICAVALGSPHVLREEDFEMIGGRNSIMPVAGRAWFLLPSDSRALALCVSFASAGKTAPRRSTRLTLLKEGYLTKQGGFFPSWKRRWYARRWGCPPRP
jgi:hypothetical protein